MGDGRVFTYQTRLHVEERHSEAMCKYAEVFGRTQRCLFAAMQAGKLSRNELKRHFLRRFAISSRQFNAIRVTLEGQINGIKKRRPGLIKEAELRVCKSAKTVTRMEKKSPRSKQLHQKKRRLATLRGRLDRLKADEASGTVRICFGGRKLFRAQLDLHSNGFQNRGQCKDAWEDARANQFFVLGSQDEVAGCQGCQTSMAADGSLSLKLRLPDALTEYGKHVTIEGVRFAYGHESIVAALERSQRVQTTTAAGKPITKRIGTALSYRFLRDDFGWRVFVSVEVEPPLRVTNRAVGAIGIDINADHLAVAEVDRFGNLVGAKRITTSTYGKSKPQTRAIAGDAAVAVAADAKAAGKPIVIEALDFQKRKAELGRHCPAKARMLSSFPYGAMVASLIGACFRAGVEVIEINPAYTSVIGAVNHAQTKGISVHQSAAMAIARRGLGLSERPTTRTAVSPTRNGGHVTFALPVRNRAKHVWSFCNDVRRRLTAAHVAHFRCGAHRLPPPPLQPERLALSANWSSTVGSRGANRSQHCSESVVDDVPW